MNKPKGKPFDKCFIDADSIIYRIALKDIALDQAKSYYDEEIEKIGWDTCSSELFVALKGTGNFRYDIDEDYKAKRKLKLKDKEKEEEEEEDPDPRLTERRKKLNEYAYSLGHFKSDNCEADDVVSIWAQEALDAKEHFVIAHIDKDIDMVEGWHYNFNKETVYYICEDQGYYKMCIQMLTGDSTDSIQGLVGIGPKKAEKLLADVRKPKMLAKVQEAWQKAHPEDWQERLETCWNLIYMRRDWDSFHRLTIEETLNDSV